VTDQRRPAASLDEMRALLEALPAPAAAPEPSGESALEAVTRLAGERGLERPRLDHPRVALFAAAHGVAARLPRLSGADLGGRIEAILERRDRLVDAAEAADADLRLYELGWPRPSADLTRAPALSDGAAATAMAYGMMAVDEAVDILGVAALGDENTVAVGAIGLALFGGAPGDWAPREAASLVEQAVARHARPLPDAFELLRRVGGEDIAALTGAVFAAHFARIAVVLDGGPALAAAAILARVAPAAIRHCLSTERSRLGEALGLPVVPGAIAGDGGLAAIAHLRAALDRATV
jgi:nicotinate-nucleotide--dimethylbenzimidazole phosphoribosyltransferase